MHRWLHSQWLKARNATKLSDGFHWFSLCVGLFLSPSAALVPFLQSRNLSMPLTNGMFQASSHKSCSLRFTTGMDGIRFNVACSTPTMYYNQHKRFRIVESATVTGALRPPSSIWKKNATAVLALMSCPEYLSAQSICTTPWPSGFHPTQKLLAL